jgi:hypothetical protein
VGGYRIPVRLAAQEDACPPRPALRVHCVCA